MSMYLSDPYLAIHDVIDAIDYVYGPTVADEVYYAWLDGEISSYEYVLWDYAEEVDDALYYQYLRNYYYPRYY